MAKDRLLTWLADLDNPDLDSEELLLVCQKAHAALVRQAKLPRTDAQMAAYYQVSIRTWALWLKADAELLGLADVLPGGRRRWDLSEVERYRRTTKDAQKKRGK